MENKDKRFDEGFDNILTFDYDKEYRSLKDITVDSLIYSDNREKISLNGKWNFGVDVFDSVIRSRWFEEVGADRNGLPIPMDFSFDTWDTVDVPGVWNTAKPEYSLYEGTGLYIKNINYELQNKRVFLRIGSANYESRIWLNKEYLGKHKGGFTPFMVEITEQIKVENRLLIYVNNTRKSEEIPSTHYDWFNYGGIHRDVELIIVPKSFIKSFEIHLAPDGKYNRLSYHLGLVGKSSSKNCVIKIPELNIEKNVTLEINCNDNELDSELNIRHYKGEIMLSENELSLWSPENPKLYDIIVNYDEDIINDRVGFRQIETIGSKIFLNGKDIFLKGMCVHEESDKHRRCVTMEDMRETLLEAKELNCNFLRLTHYPHNEMMSKLADEIGILLWEEIPVYWALEFSNKSTFHDANNQLQELIRRDINRASVIIWSVGNENPDSDERYEFMSKLVKTVKQMDKSRLVAAACLIDMDIYKLKDRLSDEVDVIGINEYIGWYIRDYSILEKILNNSKVDKPVIITETGAEAIPNKHSNNEEIYSEECQESIYKRQFSTILKYDYIRGITPWILYDYASMRRMHTDQKGYNLKGIISKDRMHKKLAYYVVQKVYSDL
jgi:beta-glucuronidase